MRIWKLAPRWALVAAALAIAGCGNRHSDFLIVASADCQGYLDPCG
jgi:hypothetical protein